MVGTLDESFETLRSALTLFDFRNLLRFACVRDFYKSMICDIAQNPELAADDLTHCFHLQKAKVQYFNGVAPAGLKFKSLSLKDLETINNLWSHRFTGSETYIENLILNNITLALFKVANNEIVGWVLW